MKWYSVKKHKPLLTECCCLLVMCFNKSKNLSLFLGEWDGKKWVDHYDKEDIEDESCQVLYFCYPDPIPIEVEE